MPRPHAAPTVIPDMATTPGTAEKVRSNGI